LHELKNNFGRRDRFLGFIDDYSAQPAFSSSCLSSSFMEDKKKRKGRSDKEP
jgi:hypothetical protein